MYRGWFELNHIEKCVAERLFDISILFPQTQILWAAFGNFNVTTRCANIIPGLSASWVVVHVIFAFTAYGRMLYM